MVAALTKYKDAIGVGIIVGLIAFCVHNAYFSEESQIAEIGRISFCTKTLSGSAQFDRKNRYLGCVTNPLPH